MFTRESARIGCIGAGRLAASLTAALHAAGYRIGAVSSANPESAAHLARSIGAEAVSTPQEVADACDLVFLTAPDAAIAEVARQTSWRPGQAVVHCSGALDLGVLAPAAEAGALTGCLHPLQSFPAREGDATRFHAITCGIEASGVLGSALEGLAADLGAHVVRLEGVDRARYHAAAVFASNYVVSLMSAAEATWERSGLPRDSARAALAPLLVAAAQNVADRELAEALTGPVARGDITTVERHLSALEGTALEDAALEDQARHELYRRLGAELLTLDLHHPPEVASQLLALLDQREQA